MFLRKGNLNSLESNKRICLLKRKVHARNIKDALTLQSSVFIPSIFVFHTYKMWPAMCCYGFFQTEKKRKIGGKKRGGGGGAKLFNIF